MTDALESGVRSLGADDQRHLAATIAALVAPYSSLDPEVVSPHLFAAMLAQFQAALRTLDLNAINSVRAGCRTIIDRFEEEPSGGGFFAFGAVVALYYATEAALEDAPIGALHAVMRLLDLVGAADDDGVSVGLYDEAYGWVCQGQSESDLNALRQRIVASADVLAAG